MIDGRLFTRDFLIEGIRETESWRGIDEAAFAVWRAKAAGLFQRLAAAKSPNEAQTEDQLIYPLLESLGWQERDVQPNASVKNREDVPDALLYKDEKAKAGAGNKLPMIVP
jgi:hypothetical protein